MLCLDNNLEQAFFFFCFVHVYESGYSSCSKGFVNLTLLAMENFEIIYFDKDCGKSQNFNTSEDY